MKAVLTLRSMACDYHDAMHFVDQQGSIILLKVQERKWNKETDFIVIDLYRI